MKKDRDRERWQDGSKEKRGRHGREERGVDRGEEREDIGGGKRFGWGGMWIEEEEGEDLGREGKEGRGVARKRKGGKSSTHRPRATQRREGEEGEAQKTEGICHCQVKEAQGPRQSVFKKKKKRKEKDLRQAAKTPGGQEDQGMNAHPTLP